MRSFSEGAVVALVWIAFVSWVLILFGGSAVLMLLAWNLLIA